MKLPKGAGECRLAALVRSGDDEDPLVPLEEKVIADDRRILPNELVRKRDIKAVVSVDGFGGRDIRVADPQACAPQCRDVLEVSDVELDLGQMNGLSHRRSVRLQCNTPQGRKRRCYKSLRRTRARLLRRDSF